MLFSQIKPWNNSDVVPQVSTYWEVATDESFRNIIETKTTQGDDLYFFSSELTIPEMSSYYIRATRQFSNSQANITLEPKKLSNVDTIINNNIVHRDSVHVDQPYIYVNEAEFKNNDFPDFEVKTSSFRCKQDGHVSTNWIVTDLSGKIIFKSLYDKYDKVSKRFDKSNDLLNKTNLIFYVSHVTTNGMESEVAKLVLSNDNFNFEIVGLFKDIPPFVDHTLYITPPDASTRDISSIWIKKVNESGDITRTIPITIERGNEIKIPGEELTYGAQFYLDVYAVNNDKEETMKRYKLEVQNTGFTGTMVDYTYQKKFQTYDPSRYRSVSLASGFVTTESPTGKIYIPSKVVSETHPRVYRTVYRSSNEGPVIEIDFSGSTLKNDITWSSTNVEGVICRHLNDNLLLIDNSKEINSVPKACFKVYRYNSVDDQYTLQHEQTREDEGTPLGIQDCITQISRDKVWYMPVGKNYINEYDFVKNTITKVVDLTNGDYRLGSMFFNRKVGKVIIINSTGNMFSVDVDTKIVNEIGDVPYEDWVGQRLKSVELINGDVLIVNQNDMSKVSSVVYYESSSNLYTPLLKTPLDGVFHMGIIVTRSSSVYIVNKETTGDNLHISRLY